MIEGRDKLPQKAERIQEIRKKLDYYRDEGNVLEELEKIADDALESAGITRASLKEESSMDINKLIKATQIRISNLFEFVETDEQDEDVAKIGLVEVEEFLGSFGAIIKNAVEHLEQRKKILGAEFDKISPKWP